MLSTHHKKAIGTHVRSPHSLTEAETWTVIYRDALVGMIQFQCFTTEIFGIVQN